MAPGNLPPGLVKEVAGHGCILFLGPDAAESAGGFRGLPTSWQLADELARLAEYHQRYLPLPQIAQVFEHARGRAELVGYLRRRLDDPAYQPLPIHELIARLPFAAIVHAGWDTLLERALDNQQVPYRPVSARSLAYERAGQGLLVYKIYGRLDQPETLVITENDQLNVLYQLRALSRRLAELIAANTLLMLGYAPDYDSVFVRIYHELRQEQPEHLNPAYVVTSLQHPEDALQWEARGVQPLVADPVAFLYELAQALAAEAGLSISLPALQAISQAPAVTPADLPALTRSFSRVLDTVGIGELVEQTDVPVLSAAQVRDLEAMRSAYERLAGHLEPVADSAHVWLRLGNVEYSRQNYDRARHYYELALAAHPGLAEAYHNLHYLHLAQGDLAQALQAYQQAVALDPSLALLPARYQIDAVLGRGGMGIVYRAHDTQAGQSVAVKLLDRAYLRTERVVARFRREAEILQRLQHPHVVGYLDFQLYQGRMYIVMEYLGEETLETRLRRSHRLPLDEAYQVFQQLCQALHCAHQANIIHRDLKPANIFFAGGQARLIDFGLAVDLAAGQPSAIGLATGTVAYMAPEQLSGGPVDARTDIYALATVFYEMVTGRHPGQGAYHPPGEIVPGLTDALDIVLQKAREQAADKRYASVDEFCQELARILPLQPASRQAPPLRRLLARLDQRLQAGRPLLAPLVILPGLAVSLLRLSGQAAAAARAGGLLLWDALLVSFLDNLFFAWLARRQGYASLSANTSLLGGLLGLLIGLLTWAVTDPISFDFSSAMDWGDYVINLLVHTVMSGVVGSFSLLAAVGGIRLALRLRLDPRLGAWLGLGLVPTLYALFLFGSGLFF